MGSNTWTRAATSVETLAAKVPVLVPFVCPVCRGANAVGLLAVSRAGGVRCSACERWLKSADVARAIHSARTPA